LQLVPEGNIASVMQQKHIVVGGKDASGEYFPQTGGEMPGMRYRRGSGGASLPGSGGDAWYEVQEGFRWG
jgi:hypothetical protein